MLVADDELNMRRVLEAMLRREGYDVITAANGVEALSGMKANVHTVITDLKMPVLDGMALLKKLSADYPDVPVVMITAHGSVENAVEAVKLGAFDYLEKPFEQEQIRQVVAKAINTYALARQNARPEEPSVRGRFRLVGQSAAIRQIYAVVEKVANTPSTWARIGAISLLCRRCQRVSGGPPPQLLCMILGLMPRRLSHWRRARLA